MIMREFDVSNTGGDGAVPRQTIGAAGATPSIAMR